MSEPQVFDIRKLRSNQEKQTPSELVIVGSVLEVTGKPGGGLGCSWRQRICPACTGPDSVSGTANEGVFILAWRDGSVTKLLAAPPEHLNVVPNTCWKSMLAYS